MDGDVTQWTARKPSWSPILHKFVRNCKKEREERATESVTENEKRESTLRRKKGTGSRVREGKRSGAYGAVYGLVLVGAG